MLKKIAIGIGVILVTGAAFLCFRFYKLGKESQTMTVRLGPVNGRKASGLRSQAELHFNERGGRRAQV
jgi:hypothetical protein